MVSNKRILIVDDEKNIRLTLSRSLAEFGLTIDQATSGEDALEFLLLNNYDLMLLDLRLPGISGLELIQQLKELGMDVKILIITAYGTVDMAVKLLKSGACDIIEKPFSPDEIRQKVAKYI